MSKNYMQRIQALRENYMSHRVEMDILDAYYVTQGFKATEGQPWQIQKATAMKTVYENKPIFIQDNELLVGGVAFKPRAGILNPDSACSVIEKELDTIGTRKYDPFYLSEENKKLFMDEVAPYWRGKCVLDRWNAMMPEDVRTMRDGGMLYVDKKFVRGYGENTPGWRTLLKKGISGIKKEAEEKLAALDDANGEDVLKQMIFYKSLIISAEGIIALANRHADLAEKMAEEETDELRRAELLKIAEVNRNVPTNPPRNFYEALQSMLTYEFCIFMEQNASSYNLGRMDQYLIDYYNTDIANGTLTQEGAQELMDCFWIKIAEMGLFQDGESAAFSAGYNMTVQVCAGGIDKYGNDAVNELSYMTIQATEDTALKEPNMTVRYSISKNPDSFLRKAAECIRMGRTMPAIYHDDAGIKMLLNKGIPMSQAWDWTPCGCVETNLEGRLKSYTDIGEISMGGVVDMVMNNGKSRKTGEQVSIQTGDPRDFETFDNFMAAIKTQIDYFVHTMATMNAYLDYLSENYRPVSALSLTYPNCMKVGKDYANGGAEFNVGNGINIIGQADIINSVADIKNLIFDEKKVTMDELCKALDANFEGYEKSSHSCLAPSVMAQLVEIYNQFHDNIPLIEKYGMKIAIENHCDLFADEVIWLVKQLNHQLIGACCDTINSLMVMEGIADCVRKMAPYCYCVHFCDNRVFADPDGTHSLGTPIGAGNVDCRAIMDILREEAPEGLDTIDLEIELPLSGYTIEEGRELELKGLRESIEYMYKELGIGYNPAKIYGNSNYFLNK